SRYGRVAGGVRHRLCQSEIERLKPVQRERRWQARNSQHRAGQVSKGETAAEKDRGPAARPTDDRLPTNVACVCAVDAGKLFLELITALDGSVGKQVVAIEHAETLDADFWAELLGGICYQLAIAPLRARVVDESAGKAVRPAGHGGQV